MSNEVSRAPGSGAAGKPGGSPMALPAGIGLALLVLAGALLASVLHLRQHIRAQIVDRYGEILDAVAAMQYFDDKTSGDTIAPLNDPGEQLQLVLKISHLRNVIGVRLFSPEGKFVNAVPAYITEAVLPSADLASLRALAPVSRFYPRARFDEHDLLAETNGPPLALLLVSIPLREDQATRLAGVAQFLISGTSIAREYAALDRHLALQSALAFAAGGAILTAGLALAFRRLQRANRLLAERTANLLQANRELALAAKTSALGVMTSHLIHGLKNPLSGLQGFVREQAVTPGNEQNDDWQLAIATTRRMENLINRVVRVLQEQHAATEYEISLAELAELLAGKIQPAADAAGVGFQTVVTTTGALSNHEADLVLLILENLAQNAVEASPPGKTVRVAIFAESRHTVMEVQDEGPGLPPGVEARLFTPCDSSKPGGSGIGLAISRQLATHLSAELQLKCSSPQGSTFRLALPRPATPSATAAATELKAPGMRMVT
jgi:signal transduction histidine kinase